MDARNYFEQEFLSELRDSIPDEQVRKLVESSYEYDHRRIERQESTLQDMYKSVPSMLQQVSEFAGIDQKELLDTIHHTAWMHDTQNIEMLSIIRDFCVKCKAAKSTEE